jgi:hypothetical protein
MVTSGHSIVSVLLLIGEDSVAYIYCWCVKVYL